MGSSAGPRWTSWIRDRPAPLVVAGLASLANGVALVLYILGGIPLPLLLAITWTVAIASVAAFGAVGDPANRRMLGHYLRVGVAVGLVATISYDLTKAALSLLDPSPYNPFEATRIFGTILIGADAPPWLVLLTGWGFHLANGCAFAVAFACLLARGGHISMRRGIVYGIVWGLFLETFQLVLYPGWLNIRMLDEFRQISFLSHLVFGAMIGILVPAGLRRGEHHATGDDR